MKIVLIGLSSVFTEGLTYQDNLLANQLRADGNEVVVITECYQYKEGMVVKTDEEDRILSNGIHLIRMKYRNIFGKFISGKVRAVKGLYNILERESPDIIFFHGLQSIELLTAVRYKKNFSCVKLYVDSHVDFNNSATNILSKYILHKIFYKSIIKIALSHVEKVFYVTFESFEFLRRIYTIPDKVMEFYPLGGIVFEESVRQEKRKKFVKN